MLPVVAVAGGSAPTPAAPTASVGGSPAVDAALSAQDGPDALSLSASSVTSGATLAWTVYGPGGDDETAQIITAGSTSATPTWAAFTAAAGKVAGLWVIKCVLTLDGLSTTYTRRLRVGKHVASLDTHMYLALTIDYTAEATASWLAAGATPTTRTLGGVDHVSQNANRSTGFGPTIGQGIEVIGDGAGTNRLTAPLLSVLLRNLIPDWSYGTPFVIQVERTMTTFANNSANIGIELCSEQPTATSGEYVVIGAFGKDGGGQNFDYYERVIGGVSTDSASRSTASTPFGQEVVYDGTGTQFGLFFDDPTGTPPDPGSSTKTPAVAGTPTDVGPLAWVTRAPGVAAENPAVANLAFWCHTNNVNAVQRIKRLWVWL